MGYPNMPEYDPNITCDNAPFISYHLHTVLWQKNAANLKATLEFRKKFMDHFKIPETNCEMNQGDTGAKFREICPFPIDYEPYGPFLTGTMAFFIPKEFLEE